MCSSGGYALQSVYFRWMQVATMSVQESRLTLIQLLEAADKAICMNEELDEKESGSCRTQSKLELAKSFMVMARSPSRASSALGKESSM